MPMKTRTRIKIAVLTLLLLNFAAQACFSSSRFRGVSFPDPTKSPWESGETIVTLEDDGTLRVKGKGAMEDYHYNYNYPRANAPWIGLRLLITNLVIEEGVTHIGDGAFMYCERLASVTIPNSVTSIGHGAFYKCFGLTSVTIPGSAMDIRQDDPYSDKTSKDESERTKPRVRRGLGDYVFAGCIGLTHVTIGDGAKHIGKGMFENCTGLRSITIPSSVTFIADDAFMAAGRHILSSVIILRHILSVDILPDGDCYYLPARYAAAFYADHLWKERGFLNIKAIDYREYMIPLLIVLLGLSIYSFASWIYLWFLSVLKKTRRGESKKTRILLKIILLISGLAICWIWIMKPYLWDTEIFNKAIFGAGIFSAVAMLFYRLYEYRFKKAIKRPITTIILTMCHAITFAILIFGNTFKLEIKTSPENGGTVNNRIIKSNIVKEVRVTAKANDGYVFTGWSGVPLSDMSNPANAEATVVMNGNQTLIAKFERFEPRTVKIGNNTWMAENLNVEIGNSWCYDNDDNCKKYGRLYDWNTAMKACPAGWRLPDTADWNDLVMAAGGRRKEVSRQSSDPSQIWEVAGKKLKSKTGWDWNNNGTDDYGFSALPGGMGSFNADRFGADRFGDNWHIGISGNWWSATVEADTEVERVVERRGLKAWGWDWEFYTGIDIGRHGVWYWHMGSGDKVIMGLDEYILEKGFSVRCIRDPAPAPEGE